MIEEKIIGEYDRVLAEERSRGALRSDEGPSGIE
jgi:hypothetical protein